MQQINHSLLIIGYGVDELSKEAYWLVQNSWGTEWGEQGYAKILRGQGLCLINSAFIAIDNVVDPAKDYNRKFTLHLHDNTDENGPRCLDGSKSGIYFSPGSGEGLTKSIVFFEGGSWCQGRTQDDIYKDCKLRSQNHLGSSKEWTQEENYNDNFQGDPAQDPFYYNWNRFFVKYCDGAFHTSSKTVEYDSQKLYFRGRQNTLAALDFVFKKVPIAKTTHFVLTGCSTGASAVYQWTDYVQETIKNANSAVQYYALPDSGFSFRYNNAKTKDDDFYLQMQALYPATLENVDLPNKACIDARKDKKADCFITSALIQYITSPMFIV